MISSAYMHAYHRHTCLLTILHLIPGSMQKKKKIAQVNNNQAYCRACQSTVVVDDSHLCFYSPLLGPSGYPTDLVTASLVLARDQPKGIKPVTLLALRLSTLKDNIDASNKGQICFHLRARVGLHVSIYPPVGAGLR